MRVIHTPLQSLRMVITHYWLSNFTLGKGSNGTALAFRPLLASSYVVPHTPAFAMHPAAFITGWAHT